MLCQQYLVGWLRASASRMTVVAVIIIFGRTTQRVDLSSLNRIELRPLQWKLTVITTGMPGKSQLLLLLTSQAFVPPSILHPVSVN